MPPDGSRLGLTQNMLRSPGCPCIPLPTSLAPQVEGANDFAYGLGNIKVVTFDDKVSERSKLFHAPTAVGRSLGNVGTALTEGPFPPLLQRVILTPDNTSISRARHHSVTA